MNVWHYWDGANADTFQAMADEYSKSHPGVTVKAVNIPSSDLITKIQTSAKTDTLPSMAIMDLVSVPQVAQTGKLVDLKPLIDSATMSDIYPALLDFGKDGDKQYAVPVSTNNLGYMYNKDLYKKAGLNPDSPPKTWEDLVTQAQQIKDKTGEPGVELYTQAGDSGEGLTWNFQVSLWQAGGEFLSADNKTAAFNTAAGKKALQFWVDLLNKGLAPRTQWGAFEKGNAGGAQEGAWMVGIWKSDPPFDFGAATVPYPSDGKPATNMGGERAVVFTSDEATQKASADFLTWFLAPEQVTSWSEKTGMLPVRKAVGDSAAYKQWIATTEPRMQPFVDQLATAKSRPNTPLYPQVSLAFAKQIEKALAGQVSVDDALKGAETDVNAVLTTGR
ncbi:ABC transporter substrate-binding protein [Cellulomonas sp. WB94]|uniref:ABC transporter substrate-binding protein n=1 Tax=Cellulomonas sp. WB94 TaxID=2173174 RepID=UPI001F5B6E7E|nr:ABC transporter substrate-binding protein [Cellulomonas sp. WB94]